MKILILAGGRGTRLSPISTEACPKQFLCWGQEGSLLQNTVQRFAKRGLEKELFIVTQEEYVPFVERDLPCLAAQVLVEPGYKNTAAAITWALSLLHRQELLHPQECVVVTPADHYFSDEDAFLQCLLEASSYIDRGYMACLGVVPRHVETGYGYLQKTTPLGKNSYEVGRFIEKPSEPIAKDLVVSGEWLWNTGVYLFNLTAYLRELKSHAPHLLEIFQTQEAREYHKLPSLSIDKALMEFTSNLCVVAFGEGLWWDVGSWESLHSLREYQQQEVSL
ncbi:MAG: hypothetical protein FJZ63_01725 [Chlamydiae bacterium]|nr:hypothetical protein [Chlamydiota bacterium]